MFFSSCIIIVTSFNGGSIVACLGKSTLFLCVKYAVCHRIILNVIRDSQGKKFRYGQRKSGNFIFKIEWEPRNSFYFKNSLACMSLINFVLCKGFKGIAGSTVWHHVCLSEPVSITCILF